MELLETPVQGRITASNSNTSRQIVIHIGFPFFQPLFRAGTTSHIKKVDSVEGFKLKLKEHTVTIRSSTVSVNFLLRKYYNYLNNIDMVLLRTRLVPMWQQSGTLIFCSCHGIAGFLVDELQIWIWRHFLEVLSDMTLIFIFKKEYIIFVKYVF